MSVGIPATLYLDQFAVILNDVFGGIPYHVGSSVMSKKWRDVDVVVMLDNDKWAKLELGDPDQPHENGKWVGYCMAFSELGKRITGLPIDFKLQQTSWANRKYKDGVRSALLHGLLLRQNALKRAE